MKEVRPSHRSQGPRGQGLNLGVPLLAKGQVRINLCAMACPISRRLRLGITADVLGGERNRRSIDDNYGCNRIFGFCSKDG